MTTSKFTNRRHSVMLSALQAPAPRTRPYISKGSALSLTEKEKEARRMGLAGSGLARVKTAGEFTGGAMGSGNTMMSQEGGFFSVQLSTDFLELPQSLREKREIYRHFYNTDPVVGQSIDLHTELPLSKIRLAKPKPASCPEGFDSPADYGEYIFNFFDNMCKRTKLFQRLITAVHHYWLDGNTFIFAEDSTVDVPSSVVYRTMQRKKSTIQEDGEAVEVDESVEEEYPDREERELKFYQKNYRGWERLIILPLDQVKITSGGFSDKVQVELIPSSKDREIIERARNGDVQAQKMADEFPAEVREYIEAGRFIPLGTDPYQGSFVYHLAGRKGADEDMGQSLLDRCLRTLLYREKLRQAQTQIASRAMTPKRIVWAEGLSDADTDDLREQVDMALVDPDYTIVANYELHWEEMGSRDRLLDLSSEYETTDRQLHSGLGVTEAMLSGESLYSGDRIKLEIINTRYMLLREVIQEFVEEYLFKPVALRKGFVEKNKWGEEQVIYPKLSFTRLALKDSQDLYDALFNLYQKGSVSVDLILEMFNIDPVDTKEKIERDMFTVNDATFNEVIRAVYSEVGRALAEKTDITEKVAKYLGLKMSPPEGAGEEGRF